MVWLAAILKTSQGALQADFRRTHTECRTPGDFGRSRARAFAEAARSLGVVEQTLSNWVKAKRAGKLKEVSGKADVTAEQMEIGRLRAELAGVTMERDILGKA